MMDARHPKGGIEWKEDIIHTLRAELGGYVAVGDAARADVRWGTWRRTGGSRKAWHEGFDEHAHEKREKPEQGPRRKLDFKRRRCARSGLLLGRKAYIQQHPARKRASTEGNVGPQPNSRGGRRVGR